MHFSALAALSALSSVALAKEIPIDEARAARIFDNGLRHQTIVETKQV